MSEQIRPIWARRYLVVTLVVIFTGLSLQAQELVQEREKTKLVEVIKLAPTILVDLKYATADNIAHRPIYKAAKCLLLLPAAEALARVNLSLQERGLTLLIYDAYRPYRYQQVLWDICPDDRFVAHPKHGSRHNRGLAVDVALADLATGTPLAMPCAFDEFSERADRSYQGGDAGARRNRDLLAEVMQREGFIGLPEEWWHYDYPGWRTAPLLDVPLEEFRD